MRVIVEFASCGLRVTAQVISCKGRFYRVRLVDGRETFLGESQILSKREEG
jgi:hypothetical protein